ncbi:MAG: hypothetical protein KDK51_01275, partial [Deltaproteobacteria bacterium]|nr:hypothetical protein [Deltaproteobacteria bacterium]
MFRIDSQQITYEKSNVITSNLWNSIEIKPDQRIFLPQDKKKDDNQQIVLEPVKGGSGIIIRDYGLVRTSYLIGEYIGSLISAIVFGILFSLILMKIKVPPLLSLFSA